MKIGEIRPIINDIKFPEPVKVENKGEQFQNIFTDLIKETRQNQAKSTELFEEFANGGNVELHEIMIASEKAKTTLQLLVELRNKTVDMYKELTRTPV